MAAISQEALKMSNSTLEDYYKGMKMPNYNGSNVFGQMQALNEARGTLPGMDVNATSSF